MIAPSKTDRERVVPMSAELFHGIAAIIRRLRQCCIELADRHPEFRDVRFTPHDFRRLFATDLVNHGLPIHIGAALLGHLNLQTTRGYVAVFNDDLVRHYALFLDERRRQRPAEEYRPTTEQEWQEFEEHFDKRKLELGSCGRPYQTPCSHEHVCLRCPMLRVDPNLVGRLDEIEKDLLARRDRAQAEGWLAEVEGIDITLSFLRAKRAETHRLARVPGPVDLPLPMLRQGGDAP